MLQVLAIAFIVGIGSGVYSGLESTAAWQKASYDANFKRLQMHDLRASLAQGNFVDAAALVAAVRSIPHHDELAAVEPRLIVPAQIEVSTGHRSVLAAARFVGVDVATGVPHVDTIAAERGRALRATDAGGDVAVLGAQFAAYHNLPSIARGSGGTGTTTGGDGGASGDITDTFHARLRILLVHVGAQGG